MGIVGQGACFLFSDKGLGKHGQYQHLCGIEKGLSRCCQGISTGLSEIGYMIVMGGRRLLVCLACPVSDELK